MAHTTYYDLTDLVQVLAGRKHPTGIQRVQMDVFRRLRSSRTNVVPVAFNRELKQFIRIAFERLENGDIRYLRAVRSRRLTMLRALRSRAIFGRDRVLPAPGDTVFVSGSATMAPDRNAYLIKAAAAGVKAIWMCYDLIPVRFPEYTNDPAGAYAGFKTWLDAAIRAGGKFVCISDFVRDDLRAYAGEIGQTVDAVAVPLAHEFTGAAGLASSEAAQFDFEKFVLFVSSLSIRKNQFGLVRLWKKLHAEFGDSLPTLVLVGISWNMERMFAYLRETNHVNGKVVHLSEASDADLRRLYSRCEFTVFPSFYEGWGLPVGESLWMGKPCVCSNLTSLPQAGGKHVSYFNPLEDGAMEAAIRRALEGRFDAMPPPRDQLRTWDMVATDIAAQL